MNEQLKEIIKEIEKDAGKFYGIDLVISEDKDNKDYIKGFENGKKFMKDDIIKTLEIKFKYLI